MVSVNISTEATLYRSNSSTLLADAFDSSQIVLEGCVGDLVQRVIDNGAEDGLWRYMIATNQDPPRLFKSAQILDLAATLGIERI